MNITQASADGRSRFAIFALLVPPISALAAILIGAMLYSLINNIFASIFVPLICSPNDYSSAHARACEGLANHGAARALASIRNALGIMAMNTNAPPQVAWSLESPADLLVFIERAPTESAPGAPARLG